MSEGHSPRSGDGRGPSAKRTARPEPALLASRAALLALAGAIEGLMLANSPVLERYAAIRLGPDGVLIGVSVLCAGGLALAGALAALAPWIHATFLGLLVSTTSWSLAKSSQHPFWIFTSKGVWRQTAPEVGTIVAHGVAIACVCAAVLLEALQAYRAAAREQKVPAPSLARDTQRLLTAGLVVLGVAVVVTLPLVAVLDRAGDDLVGSMQGRTAFTVLVGSTALLLVGLGLMAAQGKPKPAKPVEAPQADSPN